MNLDELRICLGTEESRKTDHQHEGGAVGEAGRSLPGAGRFNEEPARSDREPIQDRLAEIEMAARLGYLLCQCTWPPQIMVLGEDGQLFRCPRCRRRRDF